MNRWGKVLLSVTIVLLAVFLYAIVSSQLAARIDSVDIEGAEAHQDSFDNLARAVSRGELDANQFRGMTSTNAEDYAMVTYTVTLDGGSLFPAEWAVLSLSPLAEDVAIIQSEYVDIAPFGAGQMSLTLLTKRDQAEQPRHLWVEYYVLGRAMIAEVQAS